MKNTINLLLFSNGKRILYHNSNRASYLLLDMGTRVFFPYKHKIKPRTMEMDFNEYVKRYMK